MSASRRLASAAVAVLAGAVACAPSTSEHEGSVTHAIIGGEPSDETQDGVLLLRREVEDGSEVICTASLVAPNLVLTARHCVAYLSDGDFSCSMRGELVPSDAEGGRLGLHVPAEQLAFYSGKTPRRSPLARGERVFSTLSPTICTNDIAFVLLDRAVALPVVPMRLDRPAEAGEKCSLVGYGVREDEATVDYRTHPRWQRRDLPVAAVGPSSVSEGVTTAPPRTILLRGPSGCIGDSGGPLLSQPGGAVLGVYSLQAGESCTGAVVSQLLVHVQPFSALIAEAFAAAGTEPEPEPNLGLGASGGDAGQPSTSPAPNGAGAGGDAPSEPDPTPPEAAPPSSGRSGCGVAVSETRGTTNAGWLLACLAGLRARRRSAAGRGPSRAEL